VPLFNVCPGDPASSQSIISRGNSAHEHTNKHRTEPKTAVTTKFFFTVITPRIIEIDFPRSIARVTIYSTVFPITASYTQTTAFSSQSHKHKHSSFTRGRVAASVRRTGDGITLLTPRQSRRVRYFAPITLVHSSLTCLSVDSNISPASRFKGKTERTCLAHWRGLIIRFSKAGRRLEL